MLHTPHAIFLNYSLLENRIKCKDISLPEAEQRKDHRPSCLFQMQSAASSQMELSESAAV